MAFPAGWPPRPATGTRSLRFYKGLTAATANFSDNAYLFSDGVGASTIRPTPYVAPGDTSAVHVGELSATLSVGTQPGGSPAGGGRDPRDAAQYANVFQRGTGGSLSGFTLSGTTVTFYDTDPSKPFDSSLIGKEILIAGATTGGNNGTFIITSLVDPKRVTYENAGGATELFPGGGTYRIRLLNEAPPKEMIWSQNIRVINTGGGDLEISFDGENVHGYIGTGEAVTYWDRYEAGIALRLAAGTPSFIVEAW